MEDRRRVMKDHGAQGQEGNVWGMTGYQQQRQGGNSRDEYNVN